jgi:hypothetical protein
VLSVLDYFERQLSIVDRTLFLKLETVSQSEQVNGNIPELVEHLLAESCQKLRLSPRVQKRKVFANSERSSS